MKVLKLVYFSDRYHLRKYGRPITNDTYFAMENGPVASGTYDITKENIMEYIGEKARKYADAYLEFNGTTTIKTKAEPDLKVFSRNEKEAMEYVWRELGDKSPKELSELTHKYPEWKKFETALENKTRILMDYNDFFEDPEDTSIDKMYSLDEEEKENVKEGLKELAYLEALWS